MNAKYLRLKATAERLIRENGIKTQIKKEVGGVDKVTGKKVPGYQEANYTDPGMVDGSGLYLQDVTVVFLPAGSGDAQLDQFREENGVLDLSRIKKVLISTEGLKWEPDSLTLVKYNGEWWKLYSSGVIDPDSEVRVLYKGYIRRV